ncbi:hypothetical protein ACFQV2_07735 [Actinokineospora soli]|uniref:Uncharacterized protein n=1 Tax=Actinokineospora soli TaxID=1048753 RepID=A0ABW2TID6_9PSEU
MPGGDHPDAAPRRPRVRQGAADLVDRARDDGLGGEIGAARLNTPVAAA